jgi:hypothetical protein
MIKYRKANNMDISKITNKEALAFFHQFSSDREVNREFYRRVPENKLDFRMVDNDKRKSDSPRESIAHQVDTSRDYINGAKTGQLKFGVEYDDLQEPGKLSKEQLLEKLKETEEQIVGILSDPEIGNKKVIVPWSKEPISAVSALWGLDSHEILHQGWNLALMDFLDIERFPALKNMWG